MNYQWSENYVIHCDACGHQAHGPRYLPKSPLKCEFCDCIFDGRHIRYDDWYCECGTFDCPILPAGEEAARELTVEDIRQRYRESKKGWVLGMTLDHPKANIDEAVLGD